MNRKAKSERKVFVKTPSGKNIISYRKRTPKKKTCKICGKILYGIRRENAFKLKKINKSFKTVNRKYGGELCSSCSRNEIIKGVRK